MVSLPGTNTAEAFYMSLPVLMVLPLNHPEKFVFDGLFQLLFKIPLLGRFLRRFLVRLMLLKNHCWPCQILWQSEKLLLN